MTTFRPGAGNASYGGRAGTNRHWKDRDTLFSDEANAVTAWLPVQAGDTINVMAHAAQLRRRVTGNAVVSDEFDVVRLNDAPIGSVSLKHKLGGEDDEAAALLGSWRDTVVIYNQPIQMRGFVRLEFGCMRGQQTSEHTDAAGRAVAPNGIMASLEVKHG